MSAHIQALAVLTAGPTKGQPHDSAERAAGAARTVLDYLNQQAQEIATLRADLSRVQGEIARAMQVLAPNVPESGLEDACRQVKQVAISEADNSATLERALARVQASLDAVIDALDKDQRGSSSRPTTRENVGEVVTAVLEADKQRLSRVQGENDTLRALLAQREAQPAPYTPRTEEAER